MEMTRASHAQERSQSRAVFMFTFLSDRLFGNGHGHTSVMSYTYKEALEKKPLTFCLRNFSQILKEIFFWGGVIRCR